MMKYIKLLMFIVLVLIFNACGGDDTPSDPCSGLDKNCSELSAEDFERPCNAQNLTIELTTSNSTNPFECKYKIRDSDGVVFLVHLDRYSNCVDPQFQFDFNKDFFSSDFIPIENLNDDSHYYETAAYRVVESVKGKSLISLTGYNDTDCGGSQEGLIRLMRELNDKLN